MAKNTSNLDNAKRLVAAQVVQTKILVLSEANGWIAILCYYSQFTHPHLARNQHFIATTIRNNLGHSSIR